MEKYETFAIGHFGLGYLLGKVAAKTVDIRLNLGLLFTISVIPDVDVFFRFLGHRGPTHSLFFSLIVSLPFFVWYRKKTIPYFVAFLSHFLLGDIYFQGIQLFWPFSTDGVYVSNLSNRGGVSVVLELALFVITIVVMLLNKDFQKLLFDTKNRIYWLIPFVAVLGPLAIGTFNPEYSLPYLLVIPSLFYSVIFCTSLIGKKPKK